MKFVLFLTSLFLASCSSLPPRASLVGDWRYADERQSCRYSFQRNGTFSGEVTTRARVVSKFSGRWAVGHGVLLYEYLSDALGRIPPGTTDRDTLLAIDKDSFLIEAADGSRRRYRRLR